MKALYPAWVLLALSQPVLAAPLSPADRSSIEQQQQQLLLHNQQQRESLERAVPLIRPSQPERPGLTSGPCFTINRIVLDGATLIDARKQRNLLAPWQGQCLDMARINKLTNSVSDWYISRGYITSRAFLTEQDLRSGELRLGILEPERGGHRADQPHGRQRSHQSSADRTTISADDNLTLAAGRDVTSQAAGTAINRQDCRSFK